MDSINNACKFGSDAWLELQAFKTRQLNRRQKLNRHKNIHKDLINGIATGQSSTSSINHGGAQGVHCNVAAGSCDPLATNHIAAEKQNLERRSGTASGGSAVASAVSYSSSSSLPSGSYSSSSGDSLPNKYASHASLSSVPHANDPLAKPNEILPSNLDLVECLLLLKLCDVALKLPIDSMSLQLSICKRKGLEATTKSVVENLLQKFALQELITIEEPTTSHIDQRKTQKTTNLLIRDEDNFDEEPCIFVTAADHTRLVEFDKSIGSNSQLRALVQESKAEESEINESETVFHSQSKSTPNQVVRTVSSREDSSSKSRECNHRADQETDSNQQGSERILSQPSSNISQSTCERSKQLIERKPGDDLESLLLLSSTKEKESKKLGEELLELLSKPTAKERDLLERFRSADGYQVQEFCPKGTKGECKRKNKGQAHCTKLHFKKIIAKHTEESLGDCSFLNTCFHMDSCKYVHYEVDYDDRLNRYQFKKPQPAKLKKIVPIDPEYNHATKLVNRRGNTSINVAFKPEDNTTASSANPASITDTQVDLNKYTLSKEEQAKIEIKNRKRFKTVLYPPQWIQCDLRFFDMSLLGKFSVVMADPPWDIHMELPYGTMSDDEMRRLNVPALQDEGVIFLWVTGRAMELGRECLALWGYERCDEIIWVKTNQLQRIIRTGRTGHWLNHGKEHCLVGLKGSPKDINRGLDCDVIVAEVRATSHKPDEIYGIIERLSPGTRKIELFGRAHNVQPNWITLGNQLDGVQLIEPNLVNAFKELNLPFQTTESIP